MGLGKQRLGRFFLGGTGANLMPGFDYFTNVTALQTVLSDANTTTSTPYLSQDLSTTVQNIVVDDIERVAIHWNDLPALLIRIGETEEDFAALGNTGSASLRSKKKKRVTYEIFAVYGKETRQERSKALLQRVYNLAQNVEAVIEADTKLGSTALWSNPRLTDFGDIVVNGDAVKGFRMDVIAEYLFK